MSEYLSFFKSIASHSFKPPLCVGSSLFKERKEFPWEGENRFFTPQTSCKKLTENFIYELEKHFKWRKKVFQFRNYLYRSEVNVKRKNVEKPRIFWASLVYVVSMISYNSQQLSTSQDSFINKREIQLFSFSSWDFS